jgi:hypothetical protein
MTKSEAIEELRLIKLVASGDTRNPGYADAATKVMAAFYAPGAWGKHLSDSELDERQEAHEGALLEAATSATD